MITELTRYLDDEAERVAVRDAVADIEAGRTPVPVVPAARDRGRPVVMLVGVAAAVAALVGVTALGDTGGRSAADVGSVPGAADDAPVVPVEGASPVTTAIELVSIPLPEGGTLQGFTPSCTTRDGIEFECAIEGYRQAGGYDDRGVDHTGEAQAIVSAASVVIGGCRSTSADGSTWQCALGPRAVELQIIAPSYLGDSAPIGYAAG